MNETPSHRKRRPMRREAVTVYTEAPKAVSEKKEKETKSPAAKKAVSRKS